MGAQVNAITPKSPAAAAKLQPGDVILEFNHIPIEDDLHLINVVSVTPLGKSVPMLVYRDRRTLTLNIEVSDREQIRNAIIRRVFAESKMLDRLCLASLYFAHNHDIILPVLFGALGAGGVPHVPFLDRMPLLLAKVSKSLHHLPVSL